ncbi:centrosomal protein 43 isoform X2 [Heteronotia binoei]|uniref:centrosomal protein 43 isoform X2 n=1 Tax=Heteronotia binoei TaxID=13085 RepID=UPI00293171D3|nr:centrosomal protein 43 isoform X2 [Heteronotia binoei]
MAAGTEEDTELRDLLVQTLESSGVLNKIKAELRAAVFLALEEQEKVENKTPLVNESLKTFLNTKDGRLVTGLVTEFLQFFNLDFTLAVFQPESSTLNGLEARENLAQDLGIIEAEGTVDGPLLLEVVKRCQKKGASNSGEVIPIISGIVHSPPKSSDGRLNLPPLPSKVSGNSQSDTSISSGETKSKGIIHFLPNEAKLVSQQNRDPDTKEKNSLAEVDDAEEDPFFDDPIPKPEQTYGCDTVEDTKELSITEGRQKSWERKNDSSKEGNVASLSDAPPINSGLNSLIEPSPLKEPDRDEEEYADDFNSASQRSEKSEASIGEEIEDISVELDEFNTSDKLEDLTQDFTISQLSGHEDYLEDVA